MFAVHWAVRVICSKRQFHFCTISSHYNRKIILQNQCSKTLHPTFFKYTIQRSFSFQNFFNFVHNKLKSFLKMEDSFDFETSPSLRYMKTLDRDAFVTKLVVPSIIVDKKDLGKFLQNKKIKRKILLKIKNLNPVIDLEEVEQSRRILLDPKNVKTADDLTLLLEENHLPLDVKLSDYVVTLSYENWTQEKVLQAVLPDGESCRGFSRMGHIAHVNLKDHLLPYKHLIGQVIFDKIKGIRLVLNKTDAIHNIYRNFTMEKLAGDSDDMVTTVVEHGTTFTFDFAKVYWNSRLSEEHNRITTLVKPDDIMYDIMAGVGPFAIPAAKKKCTVLANDLNPTSYEYLQTNCAQNKVDKRVTCYNLDGNEFIRTIVKEHLVVTYKNPSFEGFIHMPMNLPGMAIKFLPSFVGLLSHDQSLADLVSSKNLPIVHVYMFAYTELKEFAMHLVATEMEQTFGKIDMENVDLDKLDASNLLNDIDQSFVSHIVEVAFVRRVAPSKVMMRVSFKIPQSILFDDAGNRPASKKIRVV